MSVIIRLQNLPWSANALDIRQYFGGLSIPEGGVHIVGGELGDAFIAFSTDEDARQAFLRNNGKIREVQISLMLSSRTEMQKVIEQARAKSYAAFMQPTAVVPTTPSIPAQVPLPSAVPQIIPAAVPELKKEKDATNDKVNKRDSRRKSRSKSKERDRKDRSRDRDRKDRKYRDRSRSKSRERKGSRRRDRSRSRNRSRSRERERRNSSKDHRKRSEEKTVAPPFQKDQRKPDPWVNPAKGDILPGIVQAQAAGIVPLAFQEPTNRAGAPLNGFQTPGGPNNFPQMDMPRNARESWPPANQQQGGFQNRNTDNFNQMDQFPSNERFRNKYFNRFAQINVCISLEPFFGGYSDIRKFFQGMFISNKGIKVINDASGRRTGIVYVQFSNERAKQDALDMSGRKLNGLEVTISHIDDKEFEEAVDRYAPSHPYDDNFGDKLRRRNGPKMFNKNDESEAEPKDICLTVDDLPNYVKDQDILHIFEMYPLVALNIVNRRREGPIAYVKFGSKEEAKKALAETSSHVVGGKPVRVRACSDEVFEENNKQPDIILTSPKVEDIGTDCLSVSRLPQKTTDKDIADFFSDIGVIPTKIHLMSNNMGFTGEAYCEFLNTEEATRAAKKNETMLGPSAISVVPITRQEMNKVLGSAFPAPMEQPGIAPPLNNPQNSPPQHFSGGNQPQEGFGGHKRGQFFNNRKNFDYDRPQRGGRFQGPRGGPGHRMRFHGNHMDGDEIPPGCTIYMKNVPYKANTSDILDFFEGYNHTGNVSRRYNPNNTPTDEAKITFYDPEEASRAIEDMQKMKIWDRSIFLRQE